MEPHDQILVISEQSGPLNSDAMRATALTRVSHLIREESIPILYQDFQIELEIATAADRRDAIFWVKRVMDPAIVSSISRYTFAPLAGCFCHCAIDLTDLGQPVRVVRDGGRCYMSGCEHMDFYANVAREKVMGLETVGTKRRIMTEDVLKGLLLAFCTMSKLCQKRSNMGQTKEEKASNISRDL